MHVSFEKMQNRRRAYRSIFFAIAIFLFSATASHATSIDPLRQTIVVQTGTTTTVSMRVTNTEEKQRVYSFDVDSFSLDPVTGAPSFYKEEGVADWVLPRIDPLLIGAGQTKLVTFDISVPRGAPSTSRYLALFAREHQAGGGNISVVSRVGSLLFLHIAHKPVLSLEVVELSTPNIFSFSGRLSAKTVIQNQGTIHMSPQGFIEVLDSDQEQIQQYKLADGKRKVLPHERQEFETLFEPLSWKYMGKRTVRAVFFYGDEQERVATTTVWYISWYIPSAIIAMVLFVSIFFYGWTRKNH